MDLRVPFATYQQAGSIVDKLEALLSRVQPVMFAAETPGQIESTLENLTMGQRALWAVEQLQMEIMNGGLEQYFFNSAGGTALEAAEGLSLFGLKKFEKLLAKALKMFPGGIAS